MDDEYPIIDISSVELSDYEQMGTKSKFWYKNEDGELYLFKATLSTNRHGEEVSREGEDWAEKISCEVAKLLSLPCADYELAVCRGQRGVITQNFVASDENMLYGNVLIAKLAEAVNAEEKSLSVFHGIAEIVVSIKNNIKNKPRGWNSLPSIKTASDFFIGYLMLDVLISNQDRHNENWGMIGSKDKYPYLAPSFDHAASLGRNESDEIRRARLDSSDRGQSMSVYVAKAKSQIYSMDGKRLKTIDAFVQYAALTNIDAAFGWLDILEGVDDGDFERIISRVPVHLMSDTSKEFTLKIIKENKVRLLASREILHELKNRKDE